VLLGKRGEIAIDHLHCFGLFRGALMPQFVAGIAELHRPGSFEYVSSSSGTPQNGALAISGGMTCV
jgi:hypothetical protein